MAAQDQYYTSVLPHIAYVLNGKPFVRIFRKYFNHSRNSRVRSHQAKKPSEDELKRTTDQNLVKTMQNLRKYG